jgi:hypothetical protein
MVVELWCVFLLLDGRKSWGSTLILSASYSQEAGFYSLFHIGQGVLTIKDVTIVKL